jgi:hypothetical protein
VGRCALGLGPAWLSVEEQSAGEGDVGGATQDAQHDVPAAGFNNRATPFELGLCRWLVSLIRLPRTSFRMIRCAGNGIRFGSSSGARSSRERWGPTGVVTPRVFLEYDTQMPFIGDEHPIGALSADYLDPAFCVRVHFRALR